MQKIERKDVKVKPAVLLPAVESSEELPRSRSNTQARLVDENCQGVRVDVLWCSDDFEWGTVIPSCSQAYFKEKPCFGDLPFLLTSLKHQGMPGEVGISPYSKASALSEGFIVTRAWHTCYVFKSIFLTWRLFNSSVSYTYNMVKSMPERAKSCSGCQDA